MSRAFVWIGILALGLLSACASPRSVDDIVSEPKWTGLGVTAWAPPGPGWTVDAGRLEDEWKLIFERKPEQQPDQLAEHYSYIRIEVERLPLEKVRARYPTPKDMLQWVYEGNSRDEPTPDVTVVTAERDWVELNGMECLQRTFAEEKASGEIVHVRDRWHTDCAYEDGEWIIAISVAVTDAYTKGSPVDSVREEGEQFVAALRFGTAPVGEPAP